MGKAEYVTAEGFVPLYALNQCVTQFDRDEAVYETVRAITMEAVKEAGHLPVLAHEVYWNEEHKKFSIIIKFDTSVSERGDG